MGLSAIAIGIRLTGLLPSQVSALGISLSGTDQSWMVRFIYITILYLLATFVIYAIADYWSWEENLKYRLTQFIHTNEQGKFDIDEAVDAAGNTKRVLIKADYKRLKAAMDEYVGDQIRGYQLIWRSSPIAFTRLCLDLIAPVVVSLVACRKETISIGAVSNMTCPSDLSPLH